MVSRTHEPEPIPPLEVQRCLPRWGLMSRAGLGRGEGRCLVGSYSPPAPRKLRAQERWPGGLPSDVGLRGHVSVLADRQHAAAVSPVLETLEFCFSPLIYPNKLEYCQNSVGTGPAAPLTRRPPTQ